MSSQISEIFKDILLKVPDFMSFRICSFEIFAKEKMQINGKRLEMIDDSQLIGYNFNRIEKNLNDQYKNLKDQMIGNPELNSQIEEEFKLISELVTEWKNIIKAENFSSTSFTFEKLLDHYQCLEQFKELKLKEPELTDDLDRGLNIILTDIRTIRKEVSDGKRTITNRINNCQPDNIKETQEQIQFLDIFGHILCNLFKQYFYFNEQYSESEQTQEYWSDKDL